MERINADVTQEFPDLSESEREQKAELLFSQELEKEYC